LTPMVREGEITVAGETVLASQDAVSATSPEKGD